LLFYKVEIPIDSRFTQIEFQAYSEDFIFYSLIGDEYLTIQAYNAKDIMKTKPNCTKDLKGYQLMNPKT
jgi:hypothetical protein